MSIKLFSSFVPAWAAVLWLVLVFGLQAPAI
jgi:hypothetical protein